MTSEDFIRRKIRKGKHGNLSRLSRYGRTAATGSSYGLIDNLIVDLDGNRLKKVRDAAPTITFAGSQDFKDYTNQTTEYFYNANGSITKDMNRGISSVTYNLLNLLGVIDIKSPVAEARNEYYYRSDGVKQSVVKSWNPNYSTSPVIGSAVNVSSLTSTETTDYIGSLVFVDGTLKRILTDNGFIKVDGSSYTYHYFIKDYLGSTRIVTSAAATSPAGFLQWSNYYPFGMEHADGKGSDEQPYKYTGKEQDSKHGLNIYDFSARIQVPDLAGRFMTMDPLAEKYYSVSPYAYCLNNPMKYVDPDGRDGMITGKGTKEDPYVVTANYYYENGSLNEDQLKGLDSAITSYNKSGGKNGIKVKNADGSESYMKYNLSVQGVDNVSQAVSGDIFTQVDGQDISYGNALGTEPNVDGNGEEFGSANAWQINLNPENIAKGISMGFVSSQLIESTYIHEIGHNLGLDHGDKTSIMNMTEKTTINNQIGGSRTTYSYPRVDKKGPQIMFNKINVPRVNSLGVIRTK